MLSNYVSTNSFNVFELQDFIVLINNINNNTVKT